MGGLIEIAGIELNAIDALLYVWFVAGAVHGLRRLGQLRSKNPEETVMKWGWVLITLYMGPGRRRPLRPGRQGAAAGRARGVHPAAVEAGHRLDRPLRRRRRHRHRHRGRYHRCSGLPMWFDIDRRVHRRLRLRPVHLPGAVHEGHDGRLLLERCAELLHARVAVDEHDDGGHVPGDGLPDDGPRHAGDGPRPSRCSGASCPWA